MPFRRWPRLQHESSFNPARSRPFTTSDLAAALSTVLCPSLFIVSLSVLHPLAFVLRQVYFPILPAPTIHSHDATATIPVAVRHRGAMCTMRSKHSFRACCDCAGRAELQSELCAGCLLAQVVNISHCELFQNFRTTPVCPYFIKANFVLHPNFSATLAPFAFSSS